MPLKFALVRVLLEGRRIVRQSPFHRAKEFLFLDGFRQKILSSTLHGVDRGGDVAVPGEKDDRQRVTAARQRRLQFQAAPSGIRKSATTQPRACGRCWARNSGAEAKVCTTYPTRVSRRDKAPSREVSSSTTYTTGLVA